MVVLNNEYIQNEFISKGHLYKPVRGKYQIFVKDFVALSERNISEIDDITSCKNLSQMDLSYNAIVDISNLKQLTNLVVLFLSHNRITHMSGFQNLKNLKTLHLDWNQIRVLEGLENCNKLEKLLMNNQQLGITDSLKMDLRSLKGIAKHLEVLNLSGNQMTCVQSLNCLRELVELDISSNFLTDVDETGSNLEGLSKLRILKAHNNPFCESRLYEETLVLRVPSLRVFDNKELSADVKRFYSVKNRNRLIKQ